MRLRLRLPLALAVVALIAGSLAGVAGAKKKKGGGGKGVTVSKSVKKAIPDAIGNGSDKTLDGKLAVPLKVKRAGAIGNVSVTIQTTGLAAGAASDLGAKVSSPDGTTVDLFEGLAGQSIGPLTLRPNSPIEICSFNPASTTPPPPPCTDPDAKRNPPYVGVAGLPALRLLSGGPIKGKWTVSLYDRGYAGTSPAVTSILNSVKLAITPG
jgi:hypothetical protein